jgi:hypothetical protein
VIFFSNRATRGLQVASPRVSRAIPGLWRPPKLTHLIPAVHVRFVVRQQHERHARAVRLPDDGTGGYRHARVRHQSAGPDHEYARRGRCHVVGPQDYAMRAWVPSTTRTNASTSVCSCRRSTRSLCRPRSAEFCCGLVRHGLSVGLTATVLLQCDVASCSCLRRTVSNRRGTRFSWGPSFIPNDLYQAIGRSPAQRASSPRLAHNAQPALRRLRNEPQPLLYTRAQAARPALADRGLRRSAESPSR